MKIEQLFTKPISRSINGVIKADQSDAASVWQELEEYVITKELDRHFRCFFETYLEAIDQPDNTDVVGKVGIWVSGFFGSGKSHFIKILSYLLENRSVTHQEQTLRAIDFFDKKIQDRMLLADIKRATRVPTDVILFNIDSKADAADGRDAILRVFLRVFNERSGFCGEHPHIAHMERHLEGLGKFTEFKKVFKSISELVWEEVRDAYLFYVDAIAQALSKTLNQTISDAESWIEQFEKDFNLSVENFAQWILEDLNRRSSKQRLIFLVDEIGQFIGQDTHLMLNLQTIVENLGTFCQGRAWVMVTSQEDIDAVLGEVRSSRANDFSKIQGRFKTRLSLSSTNVDEVIQKRLLEKTAEAEQELVDIYQGQADILKNQISFVNVGTSFRAFDSQNDFVAIYPFIPYQFLLVQKIFENIRKAGATGLHLARGERSMLDAFQSAAIHLSDQSTTILVPLYRFYPAIESFLEGVVKSTIDNAAKNRSLQPFDILLLKTLFLIRYVEEIRGNIDNLVTLFIDRIDADRRALRQQIEEGVQRLEGQTLIGQNGDNYFFLTNEERDISREIKDVDISSAEEVQFLSELIFDDVLKGERKYRYPKNSKDFSVNRLCDTHPFGAQTDGDLTFLVITPLADDYATWKQGKCVLESSSGDGKVILCLEDEASLGRELRHYLQTEKYTTRKDDHAATSSTRQILRHRADENRSRRDRLRILMERLMVEGLYFVYGQQLTIKSRSAVIAKEKALHYLVENSFQKLDYLAHFAKKPLVEIKALLAMHEQLPIQGDDSNQKAIKALLEHVELMVLKNRQIVLYDLISRFGQRPYGWPELEVLFLIIKLVKQAEISLVLEGDIIPFNQIYQAIQTPNKWRRVSIRKRRTVDSATIQKAALLAKELFETIAPTSEESLDHFIHEKLSAWDTSLNSWRALADAGIYPGEREIVESQEVIAKLFSVSDSFDRITRFLELKDDLEDASDAIADLTSFHKTQRPVWDQLHEALQNFKPNQRPLEQDQKAALALKRMQEIFAAPAPYTMIHEISPLIQKVEKINQRLIAQEKKQALVEIDQRIEKLNKDLEMCYTTSDLRNRCQEPLQTLRSAVESETSIAHIFQYKEEAPDAFDEAIAILQNPQGEDSDLIIDGKVGRKVLRSWLVIHPKDLISKPSLESQQDVDEFLAVLREKLEEAIQKDQRIEIR
ncbi:BREX system P-loop protein BrxC [Magnetococcales bacterium HHB-1]